jgi:WD40 repeat protein
MRQRLVLLAVLLLPSPAGAQQGRAVPPSRLDAQGDPLPAHALHRIGTVRLQHGGQAYALALSADGRVLACQDNVSVLRVWDARDGKPLWQVPLSAWDASGLAFSRDGKELVAVSRSPSGLVAQGRLRRWDVKTGRALHTDRDQPPAFDGNVVHVAVAALPGGKYVAAETSGADISLYFPGVAGPGKTLKGHADRVMGVVFARDGQVLVSLGADGTIRTWSVADGKEINRVPTPPLDGPHALKGNLATVAAAPDGNTLAVTFPDDSTRLLAATGKELRRLPVDGQPLALAF